MLATLTTLIRPARPSIARTRLCTWVERAQPRVLPPVPRVAPPREVTPLGPVRR